LVAFVLGRVHRAFFFGQKNGELLQLTTYLRNLRLLSLATNINSYILVLRPPRDLPIASLSLLFFAVLVKPDNATVHHQVFQLGASNTDYDNRDHAPFLPHRL
jgi:hypothetical protein